jgi:branched-chain amino acid transport system ATP-binding protein
MWMLPVVDPLKPRPLLTMVNLTAGYDGPAVLHDISVDVPEGQIITVVGPNGHGKSTLLRTISGLTKIKSGSVWLDGVELTGLRPDQIAGQGIAHVPQGDLLFPDMSVEENLLMGAYHASAVEIKHRFEQTYALLPRLAERRGQVAASLSGGERRMVGIGRGLMAGARIMMIDEPSLGLAPLVIEQIYDVIADLAQQGRTILLVEENPARVAHLSNVMHLLDDGRIVWSGAPDVLLNREELLATYLGG